MVPPCGTSIVMGQFLAKAGGFEAEDIVTSTMVAFELGGACRGGRVERPILVCERFSPVAYIHPNTIGPGNAIPEPS